MVNSKYPDESKWMFVRQDNNAPDGEKQDCYYGTLEDCLWRMRVCIADQLNDEAMRELGYTFDEVSRAEIWFEEQKDFWANTEDTSKTRQYVAAMTEKAERILDSLQARVNEKLQRIKTQCLTAGIVSTTNWFIKYNGNDNEG
ncbi:MULTISPECIES: hypothetical protein [Nostoc]|uniref:Uncharacterized protein n=1 Tax=Nostoc edaphicum CCNP1411 TaxID=1472755 RepID=A0A7D7LCL2_9NOSO|nr:hypothetical protein [Nostoc edaphicum]QMS88494.1 hypothetical protein HUN01_13140 [Nostoc edaphicum CCNP1411]